MRSSLVLVFIACLSPVFSSSEEDVGHSDWDSVSFLPVGLALSVRESGISACVARVASVGRPSPDHYPVKQAGGHASYEYESYEATWERISVLTGFAPESINVAWEGPRIRFSRRTEGDDNWRFSAPLMLPMPGQLLVTFGRSSGPSDWRPMAHRGARCLYIIPEAQADSVLAAFREDWPIAEERLRSGDSILQVLLRSNGLVRDWLAYDYLFDGSERGREIPVEVYRTAMSVNNNIGIKTLLWKRVEERLLDGAMSASELEFFLLEAAEVMANNQTQTDHRYAAYRIVVIVADRYLSGLDENVKAQVAALVGSEGALQWERVDPIYSDPNGYAYRAHRFGPSLEAVASRHQRLVDEYSSE